MDLSRFYKSQGSPANGLHPPPPTPDIGSDSEFYSDMNSEIGSPTMPHLADTPTNHDRCAGDGSSADGVGSGGTLRCVEEPQKELSKEASRPTKGDSSVLGKWNPALTLENSGSVARDHLASERTFLAYVRTSLTIASTGVALVQLFTISAATNNAALEPWSRPVGAVVIALGLSTLCFGVFRYFSIQNALIGGNYPVARTSTILLAVVLGVVIVIVFGIILGVRNR